MVGDVFISWLELFVRVKWWRLPPCALSFLFFFSLIQTFKNNEYIKNGGEKKPQWNVVNVPSSRSRLSRGTTPTAAALRYCAETQTYAREFLHGVDAAGAEVERNYGKMM